MLKTEKGRLLFEHSETRKTYNSSFDTTLFPYKQSILLKLADDAPTLLLRKIGHPGLALSRIEAERDRPFVCRRVQGSMVPEYGDESSGLYLGQSGENGFAGSAREIDDVAGHTPMPLADVLKLEMDHLDRFLSLDC